MTDDSLNHDEPKQVIGNVPLDPNQSAKITSWQKEPSVAQLKHDMEQAAGAHSAQMTKICGMI